MMVLAVILTGAGGWVLATRALKPVDDLTRAARAITAGNLTERVAVPSSRDEVARLAETFNEMIARLQDAFARERRFTDDAAHELRTPLAILRSELEIALRRDRPPEEYRHILRRCWEEIRRLDKLAEDLLLLSRCESGRLLLERVPLRLDLLCRDVFEDLRPLADARHVHLILPEDETPLPILGDEKRIRQLLLNLADNALKFISSGGRITVRMSRVGSWARTEIEDTGCGIPTHDLPHIFERFYRCPEHGVPGSGLGLAISKWIVEAHGGRIGAESEVARGSRFFFEIRSVTHSHSFHLAG